MKGHLTGQKKPFKLEDICSGGLIQSRVNYTQSKTGREVQFEITPRTAQTITQWMMVLTPKAGGLLVPQSSQHF